MANFKVHLGVALSISTIAALSVYSTGMISNVDAVTLALIGAIGGLLPDIDSENSTSVKWVFSIIAFGVSCLLLFSLLPSLGILLSLLIAIALYIGIRSGLMVLCQNCTTHRGVIHSPAFGLLCALTLAYLFSFLNPKFSTFLGLFLLLGFLIHLVLDEMYSVDLQGGHLKKSFGSALTLISFKTPIPYLIVYGLLVLIIVVYSMAQPFKETFNTISWHTVMLHLFPQRMW